MKIFIKTFIIIMLAGISVRSISQGTTLTVFSEKGENFTVFVNGREKNTVPGDVVEVTGINGPTFKLRIVFKDPAIREIQKTIFNSPSGVLYYAVRHGKKSDYVLEKTTSDYVHKQIGSTAATAATAATEPAASSSQETTKSAGAATGNESKKPGGGCDNPIAEGDFQASTVAISNAPFDPIRLTQAKKLVNGHCLYCRQIVELMYILNSESSRLILAKEAYKHSYDPENYSDVKDALHSNKSKEELERYIQSLK